MSDLNGSDGIVSFSRDELRRAVERALEKAAFRAAFACGGAYVSIALLIYLFPALSNTLDSESTFVRTSPQFIRNISTYGTGASIALALFLLTVTWICTARIVARLRKEGLKLADRAERHPHPEVDLLNILSTDKQPIDHSQTFLERFELWLHSNMPLISDSTPTLARQSVRNSKKSLERRVAQWANHTVLALPKTVDYNLFRGLAVHLPIVVLAYWSALYVGFIVGWSFFLAAVLIVTCIWPSPDHQIARLTAVEELMRALARNLKNDSRKAGEVNDVSYSAR